MKIIESRLRDNKEIDVTRDLLEMKQINFIPLDSLEAQLIADYMEKGLSFERVCEEINVDRKKENQELFTLSAIYGVVRRLKPLQSTVKNRKQGSTNVMSLKNKRGGARVKGQGKSRINTTSHRWLHPDATESLKNIKSDTSNSLKSNL